MIRKGISSDAFSQTLKETGMLNGQMQTAICASTLAIRKLLKYDHQNSSLSANATKLGSSNESLEPLVVS